ncbi:MAG: polymer-forming cytoskeletal protein [Rhodospirillales bacterium]|jgi:cytoskeletal protein CcmA (bactofilin family)|nr:polymer-forming cytoskeletal protein [Rhodospirillales bacterium]
MFSKSNKRDLDGGAGAAKPAVPSIISTDMKIVGDLTSEGEIQVDGTVEGDIHSRHLLIGGTAQITGEIVAEVVEVYGTIHGQIKATTVSLAKTAHVVGDILHDNLSIEKGAFLEGHCKRMPEKKDSNERIALVRDNSGNDVKLPGVPPVIGEKKNSNS